MKHGLQREIFLQPAGRSQQNKKSRVPKIGTRLPYPQSVTATSSCGTRTSDIHPNATRQTAFDVGLSPLRYRYQHSLYPHSRLRRKNLPPRLGVRAKITTFAHGVTPLRRPAPVREKNRPKSDSEPEFYIFPRISDL